MKVSIIAFNNLFKSPYVNPYIDFCKRNGLTYEVIFPNRSGKDESCYGNIAGVEWNASKNKVINISHFIDVVIRKLKREPVDFVIVLTTMPAALLGGFLKRNYRGRYLVDVRDYTYEHIYPYYLLVKRAVKYSALNVISSPGFRDFLPAANYEICHNVNNAYRDMPRKNERKKNDTIVIGYVGLISYADQCLGLIRLVEKDPRFSFHFHGIEGGENKVTSYILDHPSERIKYFGPYTPDQKIDVMTTFDLMFNVYGFGNKLVDYALSNKLYDSYYMQIPLLTSPGTAMSKEGRGFCFDIDPLTCENLDNLYAWYQAFDREAYSECCKEYLEEVFVTQDRLDEKMRLVILGKNRNEL